MSASDSHLEVNGGKKKDKAWLFLLYNLYISSLDFGMAWRFYHLSFYYLVRWNIQYLEKQQCEELEGKRNMRLDKNIPSTVIILCCFLCTSKVFIE